MNIFARELNAILAQHGKDLSSLYTLRSETFHIFPNKVTRLRRSLTRDITATLNSEELELLQKWVPLDAEGKELLRLRAALVAEAVRHLLSGRIERDKANAIGETVFQLLLGREPEQMLHLRDELLKSIRGGPRPPYLYDDTRQEDASPTPSTEETPPNPIEEALETAIAACEQGLLWLEVARGTDEPLARLGYFAQAKTLLHQARSLAINAPAETHGTPEQQQWLAMIEQALADETAPSS